MAPGKSLRRYDVLEALQLDERMTIREICKKTGIKAESQVYSSSSGVGGYWLAADMQDVELIAEEYVSRSREMEEKSRNLRRRGAEIFGPQMPLFKVN